MEKNYFKIGSDTESISNDVDETRAVIIAALEYAEGISEMIPDARNIFKLLAIATRLMANIENDLIAVSDFAYDLHKKQKNEEEK